MTTVAEIQFNLPSASIAALRWNVGAPKKVIALHGWLDNAASFSLLAPLLVGCDVLALDLAGHGRSSKRSGHGAYNIWQDLPEILQVADHLEWESFYLLGHSRGAMIATLLAGCFPGRVQGTCLIDAVLPLTLEESQLPDQLASALTNLSNSATRKTSYYPTEDKALSVRKKGLYPVSSEAARLFAERGLSEDANGFYWHHDPRLLALSELRLNRAQALAFINKFTRKALVIKASEGLFLDASIAWMLEHDNVTVVDLVGPHHIQMTDNPSTLKYLARVMNDYISIAEEPC